MKTINVKLVTSSWYRCVQNDTCSVGRLRQFGVE